MMFFSLKQTFIPVNKYLVLGFAKNVYDVINRPSPSESTIHTTIHFTSNKVILHLTDGGGLCGSKPKVDALFE